MQAQVASKHKRCIGKQALAANASNAVLKTNYARAWEQYIDGNVPSQHLSQLITNALLAFKCSKDGAKDVVESADDSDADAHIHRFKCGKVDLRHLLRDGASHNSWMPERWKFVMANTVTRWL